MRHIKLKHIKQISKIILLVSIIYIVTSANNTKVFATADSPIPFSIDLNVSAAENGKDVVSSLQILFILTLIALAPSILVMMTSFTRIIVVLHFVRSALATQQTPPNQVLIGLALFITLFVMAPVMSDVNETALQPYSAGEISQDEAIKKGLEPIRKFMLNQVNDKDLALFLDIAESRSVTEIEDIPTSVLIPAFIISELRAAFIIGFLIYIPFIVIDMVVASTLMSMGMMMLPPVMISLPFKLLLFILADGWNLIIGELVKTIRL
ncbi:flagellar type III secretion system pore protein FliP [Vallitalea guaymasensis]|uniref:flagellar type III secretion system pore protein FliP n=1 Tax=Vallitalea guaymasensis TaxID=1185412 RepID=UPI000DE45812|nr:flagellar type III secretion system pore protein FliP [Vallitalea guaymasensis]